MRRAGSSAVALASPEGLLGGEAVLPRGLRGRSSCPRGRREAASGHWSAGPATRAVSSGSRPAPVAHPTLQSVLCKRSPPAASHDQSARWRRRASQLVRSVKDTLGANEKSLSRAALGVSAPQSVLSWRRLSIPGMLRADSALARSSRVGAVSWALSHQAPNVGPDHPAPFPDRRPRFLQGGRQSGCPVREPLAARAEARREELPGTLD